jgi:hypothetical protein
VIEQLAVSSEVREALGLTKLPHYSTLAKFADREGVMEVMHAMLATLAEMVDADDDSLCKEAAMDATRDGSPVMMTDQARLEDQLKKMSADEAAAAIADLAARGVFLEPDVAWRLLDDPATAMAYLDRTTEPFGPPVLKRLKEVFGKLDEDADRARVAAILYRYFQVEGRDWLVRNIENENVDSVIALVLNRDPAASEAAEQMLSQMDVSDDLLLALATWKRDAVEDRLMALLRRSPRRSSHIASVALAGINDAVPILEGVANAADDSPRSGAKFTARAALVRLGHDQNVHWKRLKEACETENFEHAPSTISLFQALELSGHPEAAETLRVLVLRLRDDLPLGSGMGNDLLLKGTETLARIDAGTAEPLSIPVLESLNDGPAVRRPVERIAYAIGGTVTEETHDYLQRQLQEEGLVRILRIRELRKIAVADLPALSRWLGETRGLVPENWRCGELARERTQ